MQAARENAGKPMAVGAMYQLVRTKHAKTDGNFSAAPGRRWRTAALGVTALLLAGPAIAAPYRIEVGDVLEFSVASLPSLKQRTAVDINGDVNFPLLQDIHAVGLPLAELRTKVRELISAKPFRQRGSEGHETLLTIDPEEITISIVEYRPIYITGDVGRPGEQPFRPGITVRQAVALGGGYDAAQSKLGNPGFQLADLRSEYQSLWTNLIAQRVTITRVQAELDDRATFEQALETHAPVETATQRAISEREGERLSHQVTDYKNEKAFLARSVDEADKFLSVLKDQQANEKQGADLDAQDFDRLNSLFAKGAVPITRVIDARRSLLLSSTRQLQTSVQVAESEIRREGLIRSSDKLDDQRRARLFADLQTANLQVLDLQSKLRAVVQKLALLGKTGDPSDETPPDVQLLRRNEAAVAATDDTELQPGDVVKVRIKRSDLQLSAIE